MTSDLMGRLMGDPPFRADVYRDDLRKIEQQQAALEMRVRESVAPPTPEEQARALWDAGEPLGMIAQRTGLTIGQIYATVNAR